MQTLTDKFKDPPPVKPDKPNQYTTLLQKIQDRAMKVACETHPAAACIFGEVLTDPYINDHPQDSDLWIKLFLQCTDYDLYARLFFMRGGGTILVKDKYWGYKMRPVIGLDGWDSRNQYLIESACLNDYKDTVITMLRNLGVD